MTSATTTPASGARGSVTKGRGYGLVLYGVLAGNQVARWFAVAVLVLNAIDQLFFLPSYPFWSLVIIALDVIALYGLCAYGSYENLAAA